MPGDLGPQQQILLKPELSQGSRKGKVESKGIGKGAPKTEVVMVLLGLAGLEVVLVNVFGS